MLEFYDNEKGYCRKLGHHLHFKYCRTERDGKPCNKIKDCWFEKFDVATFMQNFYSELENQPLEGASFSKTVMLLNIVQQVQETLIEGKPEISN